MLSKIQFAAHRRLRGINAAQAGPHFLESFIPNKPTRTRVPAYGLGCLACGTQ